MAMAQPKDTQDKLKQEELEFPFMKISDESICINKKLLVHQNSQVAIFLSHPSTFALTVSRPNNSGSFEEKLAESMKCKRKRSGKDSNGLQETTTSPYETSEEESTIKDKKPAESKKAARKSLERHVVERGEQEDIPPPGKDARRRPGVEESAFASEIQEVLTRISITNTNSGTVAHRRPEIKGDRYAAMVNGPDATGQIQVVSSYSSLISRMENSKYPAKSHGVDTRGSRIEDNRYPTMIPGKAGYRRYDRDSSHMIGGHDTHTDSSPFGYHQEPDTLHTRRSGSLDGITVLSADASRLLSGKQESYRTDSDAQWARKCATHVGEHERIRPNNCPTVTKGFHSHHVDDDSYAGVDTLSRPTDRPGTLRDKAYENFLNDRSRAHSIYSTEMKNYGRHLKDDVSPSVSTKIGTLTAERLEDRVHTMYPKYPERTVTRPREPELKYTRYAPQNCEEEVSRKTVQVSVSFQSVPIVGTKDIPSTWERSSYKVPKPAAESSRIVTKDTHATVTDGSESRQNDMTQSFQWHWNKLTENMDEKDYQSSASAWSVDKLLQRKLGEEALQVYLIALSAGDIFWVNRLLGLLGHLLSNARKTSTFLNLNVRDMIAILSSDYLDVPHERHVFYAVYSWLQHNPSERLHHANAILRCVRFGLMTSEELVKCALCSSRLQKIIMTIPEYQEALLKACVAKKVFHKMPATSEFKHVKPRIKNNPEIYYNSYLNNPDKECPCHPQEKRRSYYSLSLSK